jgi:hypothetical protein
MARKSKFQTKFIEICKKYNLIIDDSDPSWISARFPEQYLINDSDSFADLDVNCHEILFYIEMGFHYNAEEGTYCLGFSNCGYNRINRLNQLPELENAIVKLLKMFKAFQPTTKQIKSTIKEIELQEDF